MDFLVALPIVVKQKKVLGPCQTDFMPRGSGGGKQLIFSLCLCVGNNRKI